MWHIGIDLHREFVVMAAVNDAGEIMDPVRISCRETQALLDAVRALGAFRAVIEASGTYRWLYDLLRPHGVVLLAHPLRLRAMIQRRSKTDKLDAQLPANLLRINQIPLAYIPPQPYQQLRELTRCRARLGRDQAEVKIKLRALLARLDHTPRFALAALDLGGGGDEGDPQGRRLEELLHARAKAIQREDRTGRGRPQTGGDLLETAASLATGTRPPGNLGRIGCDLSGAREPGRSWTFGERRKLEFGRQSQ